MKAQDLAPSAEGDRRTMDNAFARRLHSAISLSCAKVESHGFDSLAEALILHFDTLAEKSFFTSPPESFHPPSSSRTRAACFSDPHSPNGIMIRDSISPRVFSTNSFCFRESGILTVSDGCDVGFRFERFCEIQEADLASNAFSAPEEDGDSKEESFVEVQDDRSKAIAKTGMETFLML